MAVLTAIPRHTETMPIILMRRIHHMEHILMVHMALAEDSAEDSAGALAEGSAGALAEGSAGEEDGGKLITHVKTRRENHVLWISPLFKMVFSLGAAHGNRIPYDGRLGLSSSCGHVADALLSTSWWIRSPVDVAFWSTHNPRAGNRIFKGTGRDAKRANGSD
jgi:hypothetical protein